MLEFHEPINSQFWPNFIVLKKICSRINYNILVLKYLDEFKHLIWLTVWQIPAGTAGIEEMGTARHGDWWSATAAPWDWEWGKTQTLPALSRSAVALQLLIVYQCNPQTHKFIYCYDLHILLFQEIHWQFREIFLLPTEVVELNFVMCLSEKSTHWNSWTPHRNLKLRQIQDFTS